jgi:hypothetical protein
MVFDYLQYHRKEQNRGCHTMKVWHMVPYPTLFLCSTLVIAQSNQGKWQSNGVFAAMLRMPAPAPPAGVPGAELPQNNVYHAPTFSPPPEDAPLEVIGRYWAQHNSFDEGKPTPATRQRLLDASQQYPELLPFLLRLLPETVIANHTIKKVYDADSTKYSEEWHKEVKQFSNSILSSSAINSSRMQPRLKTIRRADMSNTPMSWRPWCGWIGPVPNLS